MQTILEGVDTKYVLLEEIGSGATCSVYKGYSLENDSKKLLAIKIYKERSKKFFDKEISIRKILPSENFLSIFKYGSGFIRIPDENLIESSDKHNRIIYYIIEELAENGELFDFVYKLDEGFPENISIKIFTKIVKLVKILHDNRIAHCDIKPENVMVGNDFSIKLIDFGFSQILEKEDNLIYNNKGSEVYSSPEVQNKNVNGYDGLKSDIFSLGVLLFVITVRYFPFDKSNYLDRKYRLIMSRNYNEFWCYFQQFNLSPEFKDLINHLICHEPSERFTIEKILEHPIIKKYSDRNGNNQPNDKTENEHSENIIMSIKDFDEDIINELENRKEFIKFKENDI